MRIALVHELLTMRGGAERLLKVLASMFPDAPIYTLLYDEKKLGERFPKERIHLSSLQKFAPLSTNHHLYLRRFPAATEAWDFSGYDLVISSSSAFAHGILCKGRTKHLCFTHTPARYLWDRTFDVLQHAEKQPLGFFKKRYLERTFHTLRQWDVYAADRPDILLAASKAVQRRIELYWRRESTVLYPCIDDAWFQNPPSQEDHGYFLIVSTLVPYKNIDHAIHACMAANVPLKIVGEGPDRKRLEALSGEKVEFLGYQPHEKIRELYTHASATLFPGEEDFGLVPIESMACGTPVIAHRAGGALETVEKETGTFFQSPEELTQILPHFSKKSYDPQVCRTRAQTFSRASFEEGMHAAILRCKQL